MKKRIIVLMLSALVLPAFAQNTNEYQSTKDSRRKLGRNHSKRRLFAVEGKEKQRRLDFMARVMKEVGISREEKAQLIKLQEDHRRLMEENNRKIRDARDYFEKLQREGASEEELNQAIDRITSLQAEQLRILMRHRRRMEEIIGKEKCEQMMKKAREQFRRYHGYGPGMRPAGFGNGRFHGKGMDKRKLR